MVGPGGSTMMKRRSWRVSSLGELAGKKQVLLVKCDSHVVEIFTGCCQSLRTKRKSLSCGA